MKIELILIGKKVVYLAGFCAALNGLIVGVHEESKMELDKGFIVLNSYRLYWGII